MCADVTLRSSSPGWEGVARRGGFGTIPDMGLFAQFAVRKICLLALLVAGGRAVSAAAVSEAETHFAEEALGKAIADGTLPCAVSVFEENGRREIACLGYADPRTKRPVTMDSVFMQCSQTKSYTGVALAMLIEQGRVSLDDPVSKFLPEFKDLRVVVSETNGVVTTAPAKTPLTVRAAVNHSAGLDFDLPARDVVGWSRRMPVRSAAAEAASRPLAFEPETALKYSNLGLDIAAAIVETVSGVPFETFVETRIIRPLGLKDTTFHPTEEQLARRIVYCDVDGKHPAKPRDGYPNVPPAYSGEGVFAAGGVGLWTTPQDQIAFYHLIMNLGVGDNGVRLLKEETVKNLLCVSSRAKGLKGGYSIGFVTPERGKESDDAWVGHGGAWCNNCHVNWQHRRLRLWVVQYGGGDAPWMPSLEKAAERFFKGAGDGSGVREYTGRMK